MFMCFCTYLYPLHFFRRPKLKMNMIVDLLQSRIDNRSRAVSSAASLTEISDFITVLAFSQ